MKKKIVLVTGGARSGKSRHALALAGKYAKKAFVATATSVDAEMTARISKHRSERDNSYVTIEEPLDLAGAIGRIPTGTGVAVIDCLTVWLGNLLHKHGIPADDFNEVRALMAAFGNPPCDLIIVTNEVGMGIVPENALARHFRDIAGRLNAAVASAAHEVVFMVSGIPMMIKEDSGGRSSQDH